MTTSTRLKPGLACPPPPTAPFVGLRETGSVPSPLRQDFPCVRTFARYAAATARGSVLSRACPVERYRQESSVSRRAAGSGRGGSAGQAEDLSWRGTRRR